MRVSILSTILLMGMFFSLSAQNISKAEYFLDTDPGFGMASPISIASPGQLVDLNFTIPMQQVTPGFHMLYVRVLDTDSMRWSQTMKKAIFRANDPAPSDLVKLEYFIDDDPGWGNGIPIPLNTPSTSIEVDYMLDLSSETPGFHMLYIRARNLNGDWSMVQKKAFCVAGSKDLENLTKVEFYYDLPGPISTFTYYLPQPEPSIDIQFQANAQLLINNLSYSLNARVVSAGGKFSSWKCVRFLYDKTTSITEESGPGIFQIGPNPSDGIYQIQVNQPRPEPFFLTVLDAKGTVIYQHLFQEQELDLKLDLTSHAAGFYPAIFQQGEKIVVEKLVKN